MVHASVFYVWYHLIQLGVSYSCTIPRIVYTWWLILCQTLHYEVNTKVILFWCTIYYLNFTRNLMSIRLMLIAEVQMYVTMAMVSFYAMSNDKTTVIFLVILIVIANLKLAKTCELLFLYQSRLSNMPLSFQLNKTPISYQYLFFI